MDFQKQFSLRLSELRLQKNISAREMSHTLGHSGNYINMIENGNSLPSMAQFLAICEFLEVTPAVFFDFDNHNPKKSDALSEKLKGLSDEQLTIILSMIDQMNK